MHLSFSQILLRKLRKCLDDESLDSCIPIMLLLLLSSSYVLSHLKFSALFQYLSDYNPCDSHSIRGFRRMRVVGCKNTAHPGLNNEPTLVISSVKLR